MHHAGPVLATTVRDVRSGLTLAITPNPLIHDLWVALGVTVALGVFVYEKRRRGLTDERLWVVLGFAVGWGAVAARLGTWFGGAVDGPRAGLVEQFLYGNRSILGGLLGAYAGALVAKRLTGYTESTGALFTPAVAIGMAVGRVGCLLTEPPGTATGMPWGVVLPTGSAAALGVPAGVPLHPSYAYEVAFHLVAFAVVWWARDRVGASDLFVLWVGAYATFRFGVEFVRVGDRLALGLTGAQLLLLMTAPWLVWRLRQAHARRHAARPKAAHPSPAVRRTS